MKDNEGLMFTVIAETLNEEEIKTFSGTGKWNAGTLSKIYNKGKAALR